MDLTLSQHIIPWFNSQLTLNNDMMHNSYICIKDSLTVNDVMFFFLLSLFVLLYSSLRFVNTKKPRIFPVFLCFAILLLWSSQPNTVVSFKNWFSSLWSKDSKNVFIFYLLPLKWNMFKTIVAPRNLLLKTSQNLLIKTKF